MQRPLKLCVLLTIGISFCTAYERNVETVCNCDWRYYNHYKVKDCNLTEVDSCGCPKKFACPIKHQDESKKVCIYQNIEYPVGSKIQTLDECQTCLCIGRLEPQIACGYKRCPQLSPPKGGKNCHLVYGEDWCCPSHYHCSFNFVLQRLSASTERIITCEHEGIFYPLGAKIYPSSDPCMVCECTESWNGVNAESCYQSECLLEKHKRKFEAGCIPVYHVKKCCPIEFICSDDDISHRNTDKKNYMLPEPGLTSNKCSFGDYTYEIGETLNVSNSCINCKCTVPPDFTCVHQTCPVPENAGSCFIFHNEGDCCPYYDCAVSENDLVAVNSSKVEVCPTPICEDESCYIDTPFGFHCPTCICNGSHYNESTSTSTETSGYRELESETFENNNRENLNNFTERDHSSNPDFLEDEEIYDNVNKFLENTEEKVLHQNTNYFSEMDIYSPMSNQISAKKARNHRAVSSQQQQILQQTQNSKDYEERGIEREGPDINEEVDEIQIFSSNKKISNGGTSSLNNHGNVRWITYVPGCPTPICEDSSCRIGIPSGQECPTCIC